MKRMFACLLGLVLVLTLVCPAFALSKGEQLNLLVLGDSISAGTGLNDDEVPYGKMVADHFRGIFDTVAKNGNEYQTVIDSIEYNPIKVNAANCYAFSIGSNDYIEYLANEILDVIYDGGSFSLTAFGYNDISDFITDILITHKTSMTENLNGFLTAEAEAKQGWKDGFCNEIKGKVSNIVGRLNEENSEAPILILSYYDPIEPYKPLVSAAASALKIVCAQVETVDAICRAVENRGGYSAYLLAQAEKTGKAMADSLIQTLQEKGVDLADIIPGVDISAIEAKIREDGMKVLLVDLKNTVVALDQLIDFTDDVMVQMNADLDALSRNNPTVYVVDAASIGNCASNISPNDHFHPSEQGHRLIAADAINAINRAYAKTDPATSCKINAVTDVILAVTISYLLSRCFA